MLRREAVVGTRQTLIEAGMRLDQWLLKRSKWPWDLVQRTIRTQQIAVEGVKKLQAGYKLQTGDTILLPRDIHLAAPLPASSHLSQEFPKWIIAETPEHIILSKPAGMPTQGGKGIKSSLDLLARHYCPTARLMHRLDKDTTGLLALAKTREACGSPIEEKVYLGIVLGSPRQDSGELKMAIAGEKGNLQACTSYQVLCRSAEYTLLRYQLHTGRKHQIRIQSAFELMCPIVGDLRHGREASETGLCLHSWQFRLQSTLYTAPIPAAFHSFLTRAGLVI